MEILKTRIIKEMLPVKWLFSDPLPSSDPQVVVQKLVYLQKYIQSESQFPHL